MGRGDTKIKLFGMENHGMKILLMGEYSNVHATLADGLRSLGHDVTVLSDGDSWKNYPRDIDLSRPEGRWGGVAYVARLARILPRLRGFDVVQLINPMFLELKARRIAPVYRWLRRHNRKLVLGAFGMDYYWVNENVTRRPLRYSDFNIGARLRSDEPALRYRADWVGTDKQRLCELVARDCDGIVAGLYEYWACYKPLFPEKTVFVPFPIRTKAVPDVGGVPRRLRVFVGVSKHRSAYKGTDVMLRAARAVARKYPDRMELSVAEGVPFARYVEMLRGADVILDQLYSYTPAMNALEAMSQGVVCVGGGEPENYEILGEKQLRPIVNVLPNEESVCHELEQLVLHPERVVELKRQGLDYIRRHHDHRKVAGQYAAFYRRLLDGDACPGKDAEEERR